MLGRFIAELKRAQVLPERFEALARRRGATPKERDLAAIYAAYQQRLIDLRLYDDEGLFWEARDRVVNGELGPFGHARLLAADGFWDFSPAQREILKALAQHLHDVRISLTLDPDGSRDDLFHRCRRTRDLLQQDLGAVCESAPRPTSFAVPSLLHLETHVLGDATDRPPSPDVDGVEVIEAVGTLGELEHATLRVKQLLADGTPPEHVALVARTLDPYAPLIDEVARRFGVPLERVQGPTLAGQGAMAMVMAAFQLRAHDYEFPVLTKLVRSQHFRPAWVSAEVADVGDRADRVLRVLNVASGQANYARALSGFKQRCEQSGQGDEDDDTLADLRDDVPVCAELLNGLFTEMDGFPPEATCTQFAEATRTLVERLGLRSGDDPIDAEQRASLSLPGRCAVVDALDQALDQLCAAGDVLGLADRVWTLDAFAEQLRDAAADVPVAMDATDPGRVAVLSAHEARTLSFAHVFVLGLTDQQFPAPRTTGPLYAQADAVRWARRGVHLPQPRHQIHEEMLLYYASVTRARRHLVLCRSACTPDGRDELPSPFLEDTLACFAEGAVPTRRQALGDVAPPDADAVWTTPALRLFAVDRAVAGDPGPFRLLTHDPTTRDVGQHMRGGLRALRARVGVRTFGPYDGVLGPVARRRMARELKGRPRMAVTRLERYAQCPFGYFLSDVLGVAPLPEPTMELAGVRLGLIVHEILRDFHRALGESGVGVGTDDEADLLEQVGRAALERHATDRSEAEQVLWELEQGQVTALLARYLEQWRKRQADSPVAWCPTYLEVGFGQRTHPWVDPASVAKALVVKQEKETVALTGRVDRVDVARSEQGTVFAVIDYKTGSSAPKKADITSGAALQLPIYALAVQRLLLSDEHPLPAVLCYWRVGQGGVSDTLVTAACAAAGWVATQDWTDARDQAVRAVFTSLGAMRRAEFPVCPRDQCPSYCDYRHVCRAAEAEAVGKTAPTEGPDHG